jgi:OPA family glycerol-3-phosphate transporter-like MFS transporter
MYLASIGAVLAVVIGAYFCNNPMRHSRWFILRRFLNWFPLGMSYAFLYMGRYNLNVAKNALGTLMSKEQFGLIFGIATVVYACSFLINGPLVDKIGGKKGILIATIGAASANACLGLLTYLVTARGFRTNLVAAYTALYSINMYFQSYGAVSIIKVKAYWFHVRERGVFGAIFGTLISIGTYFAFDWSQWIVDQTHSVAAVFFIPAAVLVAWALIDVPAVKDTPEAAGFAPFDTHDASSGHMEVERTAGQLLKGVFTSPLMLFIAVIELTSGVFRNGTAQWYPVFAHEVPQKGAEFFLAHWGWLLCMFGIVGSFAGGIVSDKLFQSRRGPPAALLCGLVVVCSLLMAESMRSTPVVVGCTGVAIWMCAVGVTSLMSGTAATDFGGRKATATSSGIVDGFAYLGSGLQSISIGYISTNLDWRWWPLFLTPFAALGCGIAIKIWFALPPATKRYIQEVEMKHNPPPDTIPAMS